MTLTSEGSRRKSAVEEILDVENGGRPPVQIWGSRGVASSMHPLASQAAIDVLRRGGSAVDAAIALAGVISVTSPDWAGPAGDSAWLVYDAGGRRFHYLDAYSVCGARTTPERLQERFGLDKARDPRAFQEEPPQRRHTGIVTAMVPGTPAAWVELARRLGSRPLAELLDPAIELARSGFTVNRYLAMAFETWRRKLQPFQSTRAVVGGERMPAEGGTFRQPELAETLRRLAADGHDGFYSGETAKRIVAYCAQQGGLLGADDLASYRPVWRDVLKGGYRGREVIVTGPPTAGVHVLQALRVLEGFDLAALTYHGADSLHLLIEVVKLVLAERRATGGDPDFTPIDTDRMTSARHAEELRRRVDVRKASKGEAIAFEAASTTHFVVADAAGNVVTATQTIGSSFGCGEVVAGTGLFMNDRTWWMGLENGPNVVAPGRRANIGHAPTMLARDGRPFAALGSPGGFGIVQYVVQVIVNMLDYGLDLQSAIEAPRFKLESLDGRVGIESRVNAATRRRLADMGHGVFDFPPWTDRVGGVEGLYRDAATGSYFGGYDPRRNSLAVGLN